MEIVPDYEICGERVVENECGHELAHDTSLQKVRHGLASEVRRGRYPNVRGGNELAGMIVHGRRRIDPPWGRV